MASKPHTRWKDPSSMRWSKLCLSSNNSTRYILVLALIQLLFTPGSCQGVKKDFSIEENLAVGRTIGVVDNQTGYTYELATNTQYFTIHETSGEISVKQRIDREQLSNNDIKFVVKQKPTDSQSSAHTLIEVKVTILDLNDNSPQFPSSSINYAIAENEVLLQPFTLVAVDSDAGINGSSSLTYSIISGNDDGYWKITTSTNSGAKTGSLALLQEIDREDIDSFTLVVEARDGGNPARFGTANVNILVRDLNDNHPKFDFTSYSASVLENSTIGTKVLQTQATDLDVGVNSALVFSMANNSLFSIDRLTGEVRLEGDLLKGGYNKEPVLCQRSYCNTTAAPLCLAVCVLQIQVTDQEGRGASRLQDLSRIKITIEDVNDHAPVITAKKEATVSEDAGINTFIFKLTISDADQGPNGQFDLTYVSGNELGHFKQPNCLLPRYCLVTTNALVDKEKVSRYNLTFAATDRGDIPLRTTISVIVIVLDANDHSPVFSSASYSAVVSELDPINSFVAAVTATDADEGKNSSALILVDCVLKQLNMADC